MFRSRPFPTLETQNSPTSNSEPVQRRQPDYNRIFGVQPKLTVGAPNDQYEQEADRVASQVMSMPDKPIQRMDNLEEEEIQTKPLADSITPLVQRMDNLEEEDIQTKASGNADIQREENLEEEELQTKPLGTLQREEMPEEEELQTKPLGIQREEMPEEEEIQTKPNAGTLQREEIPEEEEIQAKSIQRQEMPEEEELQTKSLGNIQREDMPEEEEIQTKPALQRSTDGSLQAGSSIESQLSSSKGSGSPLPDDVRSFMEPRFGADFSQVRVHTNSEAVQMNRDLNAQAFTHQQDVYFGAGKAPEKDALTAHELTHVVQQTDGMQSKNTDQRTIQREGNDVVNMPEDKVVGDPGSYYTELRAAARNVSYQAQLNANQFAIQVSFASDAFKSYAEPKIKALEGETTASDLVGSLLSQITETLAGAVTAGVGSEIGKKISKFAYDKITKTVTEKAKEAASSKQDADALKKCIDSITLGIKDSATSIQDGVSNILIPKADEIIRKANENQVLTPEEENFIGPFYEAETGQVNEILEGYGVPSSASAKKTHISLYRRLVAKFEEKLIFAQATFGEKLTMGFARDFGAKELTAEYKAGKIADEAAKQREKELNK
jgi:Zn-dependent peptidase ImmA (M78 family)